MALGMDLDQVIERATIKPAHVYDYGLQLGTLRPGGPADVSVFEIREGTFEFIDSSEALGQKPGKRIGKQKLVSKATSCRGEPFVNEAL